VPFNREGGGHGVYPQRQPLSVRDQPHRSNGGRNGCDGPSHLPSEATHSKKNDGWELLGEAYVHSIIDGELELGRSSAEVLRHRLV